jgi:holo-ACP synthase / triphosphoribosyl-dephospho-CoA synthase
MEVSLDNMEMSFDNMEVSLTEMLQAREERALRQQQLLGRGQTMVCFTMNIAGPIKNSPLIEQGYELGMRLLQEQLEVAGLHVSHFEEVREKTGNECIMLIEADPLTVKTITADLEDHAPVGRLFDMDVLRPDGSKVERQELGRPGRKCLICGEEARACARSRKHSVPELQEKTASILRAAVDEDDSHEAARLACQALLYEAACTPKPGLVDRDNSGSHRDMDIFTFQASAPALYRYFAECVLIGRRRGTAEETFSQLRFPGRLAEGAMLRATGGVNTHKGAIFSVGILCGALGRLSRKSWGDSDAVLSECAAMTKGLVDRDYAGLTADTARTTGQKLYLDYGITGVRGQAQDGFPAVRDIGLPRLEAALADGLSINEAGCAALIAMLAQTVDTNMIHRGGYELMLQTQEKLRDILSQKEYPDASTLKALDAEFIDKNLSPGGTADLLAMTFLLHLLRVSSS